MDSSTAGLKKEVLHQPNINDFEGRSRFRGFNPLRWGKVPSIPEKREASKEYGAGFWSKLFFTWINEHMTTGYRRSLQYEDIWLVNPDRAVVPLSHKLIESFKRRVDSKEKYPLLGAIYETSKRDIWLSGICRLFSDILLIFAPFTLRYLILFVQDAWEAHQGGQSPAGIGRGIGLVLGILGMQILQSFGNSHFLYRSMIAGGQTRSTLISVIFAKGLRLSNRARAGNKAPDDDTRASLEESKPSKSQSDDAGWTNGRIMNLMSNDTQRIFQASNVVHLVWTSPIAILLAVVLLIINITYSALAGVAVLVIGLASLTRVVKFLAHRRDIINVLTDQRVSLTQEVLQGIKFVKCFAWEEAFQKRLNEIRAQEIQSVQVLLIVRSALGAVSMALPIFATLFAFITFSMTSHGLDASVVFSSLALFNCLRTPLNWLPTATGLVIDAWASIKRIEEFLLAEDYQDQICWQPDLASAIDIKDGNFTWERASSGLEERPQNEQIETEKGPRVFQLHNLNLSISRHELVAVVGTVGSGKTSLLASLAGEMRKMSGHLTLGSTRAFCPQNAWIQNATVRENILFGQDFDALWYNQIIDACALRADLRTLPAGDMTEIGERGINLSGGQKQRVNLARAIYSRCDIVLMDDPLSAVDAHVGDHIFGNAICGLLADKCRVLATHQLHVLSRCDRIVMMQDGEIEMVDTYRGLLERSTAFQRLMSLNSQERKDAQDGDRENANNSEQIEKVHSSQQMQGDGTLIAVEAKAVKSVPWSVYAAYVRASGTILNAALIIILLIVFRASNIMTSLWLSFWSENAFGLDRGSWIAVYAALAVIQGILLFSFSLTTSVFGTRASRTMLNQATWRVLRSPMSFFDTTPLGRITHRFTKDIDVMDTNLTDSLRMYLVVSSMIIGVIILTIAYFYYFVIAIVPLTVLLTIWTVYYRASARELKRFEAVLDSVVYARFSEALAGTASIRSYGLQTRFINRLQLAIDDMNSAHFLTFGNQQWLSVRLDTIGNTLVFTSGILVVLERFRISPSISGLILSYSLGIVQLIQFTVRQLAEVESAMNGTERIHEYTLLKTEAPLNLKAVRDSWPERGSITFDHASMRYRPGLPLVLDSFHLHIEGGERIGIVGRTGAGKSSVLSALFRLIELDTGRIIIDGIDISQIGLHELRAQVSIIPQDPTFFKGTVRSNLDPFGEHTDAELWDSLRKSHLLDDAAVDISGVGTEKPGSALAEGGRSSEIRSRTKFRIALDSPVDEEGSNYSLGQRQLLALARAMVRGSRIIVIDEGTSSVDAETDMKIQRTIATSFHGKTLLSIAHRLQTVINYDRICVMDQGGIAELNTPLDLWMQGGVFRGMCDRSGILREDFEHLD